MSYYECIGHSQAELDASYSNGYNAGKVEKKTVTGSIHAEGHGNGTSTGYLVLNGTTVTSWDYTNITKSISISV